jgi:hypothetical protein
MPLTTKEGIVVQECPSLPYMFVQKHKSNIATAYSRRFKVKPIIEQISLKTVEDEEVYTSY